MMEKEGRGRGENFVNRNRLNIVARSVAAVSVLAAGGVAVEKTGLFDPLASSVESANHLVLNNLRNSYNQLIDSLPEVEKAEANAIQVTFNFTNNSGSPQYQMYINFHDNDIANSDQDAIFVSGDLTCSPDSGSSPDHKWNCSGPVIQPIIQLPFPSGCGILFNQPCCEGIGNLEACTAVEKFQYDCSANAHLIADAYWGTRPQAPQVSSAAEAQVSGASSCSVGGIAQLPDVESSPQDMNSEKSKDYTTSIAAGVAAVAAAVAATGAALYSRRNRSAR